MSRSRALVHLTRKKLWRRERGNARFDGRLWPTSYHPGTALVCCNIFEFLKRERPGIPIHSHTHLALRLSLRSQPSALVTPTLRAENAGNHKGSDADSGNNNHNDHDNHNSHDEDDGHDDTMSASMASGTTGSTTGRSARINANTYGSTAVANGVCSILVLAR